MLLKLKGYRHMLGYTQSDMAKILGISNKLIHIKKKGQDVLKTMK